MSLLKSRGRIHRLAQQLHFRIPRLRNLSHFLQHRIARAAALRPARERHHAIRASLVAAFNDCQIRAPRIVAPRHRRFERFVRIGIESGHALVPCLDPRQQLRQFPVTRRPAHQADPRRALENSFAFLLRHATEHPDDLPRCLLCPILAEPRKNFLRRLFADAASVVEDQRRRVRRFHLPVSARQQHARDFLRVVVVHLAPKCFQEKSCAVSVRSCRRIAGNHVLRSNGTPRQRVQTNVECPSHLIVRSLTQVTTSSLAVRASNTCRKARSA